MFGRKGVGRMVDHVFGFVANGEDAVRRLFDGNDRRFVDDDALARNGDKGIRGTQVDSQVVRRTGRVEPIHKRHRRLSFILVNSRNQILAQGLSRTVNSTCLLYWVARADAIRQTASMRKIRIDAGDFRRRQTSGFRDRVPPRESGRPTLRAPSLSVLPHTKNASPKGGV